MDGLMTCAGLLCIIFGLLKERVITCIFGDDPDISISSFDNKIPSISTGENVLSTSPRSGTV